MKSIQPGNKKSVNLQPVYLIYPHWALCFFVFGGAVLLIIGLSASLLLGVSAESDKVYAIEALLAGLISDFLSRKILKRKPVLAPKFELPIWILWSSTCVYIFIFEPLTLA